MSSNPKTATRRTRPAADIPTDVLPLSGDSPELRLIRYLVNSGVDLVVAPSERLQLAQLLMGDDPSQSIQPRDILVCYLNATARLWRMFAEDGAFNDVHCALQAVENYAELARRIAEAVVFEDVQVVGTPQ